MKEFVTGRLKHLAGVIIHQRDTIFVRRKPHKRVSLGRENYTQEHALSIGGADIVSMRHCFSNTQNSNI